MFFPVDPELHSLAVQYADKELAKKVNFTDYTKLWAACRIEDGKPVDVRGLIGMTFRADLPLFRFTDNAAVVKLVDRVRGHLQDVYGGRGKEVYIHVGPKDDPDSMCPDFEKWLEMYGATPSDRWKVVI